MRMIKTQNFIVLKLKFIPILMLVWLKWTAQDIKVNKIYYKFDHNVVMV